jgi:hypothetical protein
MTKNIDIKKRRLTGYWKDGEFVPPRYTEKEKVKRREEKAIDLDITVKRGQSNILNDEIRRTEFILRGNHISTITKSNGQTTIIVDDGKDGKIGTVNSVRKVDQWLIDNL